MLWAQNPGSQPRDHELFIHELLSSQKMTNKQKKKAICNCVGKTSWAWIQTKEGGRHVSGEQELHMHLWTARLVFLWAIATWEGGYDCWPGALGVPIGRGQAGLCVEKQEHSRL